MTSRVIVTYEHADTKERVRLYIHEGVTKNPEAEAKVVGENYEIIRVRQAGFVPRTFDENYAGVVSAVKEEEPVEEETIEFYEEGVAV